MVYEGGVDAELFTQCPVWVWSGGEIFNLTDVYLSDKIDGCIPIMIAVLWLFTVLRGGFDRCSRSEG